MLLKTLTYVFFTYSTNLKLTYVFFTYSTARRRKRSTYVYDFKTSKVRFLQNNFLHQWSKMLTKIAIIYKK